MQLTMQKKYYKNEMEKLARNFNSQVKIEMTTYHSLNKSPTRILKAYDFK